MKEQGERNQDLILPEEIKFLAEAYGIQPKSIRFLIEAGVSPDDLQEVIEARESFFEVEGGGVEVYGPRLRSMVEAYKTAQGDLELFRAIVERGWEIAGQIRAKAALYGEVFSRRTRTRATIGLSQAIEEFEKGEFSLEGFGG